MKRMILLSEVADRLRNEVRYWPPSNGNMLRVRIDGDLTDYRNGEPRELGELMLLLCGVLVRPGVLLSLQLDGNDDEVTLAFHPSSRIPTGLEEKIAHWNATINLSEQTSVLSISLNLPISPVDNPADINAMALESGISLHEARTILKTLMPSARKNILTLKENRRTENSDRCFRAAHTLKGSAKTLRAPELAAAARAIEMEARNDRISESSLSRLDEAWNRLETWMDNEVNAHAE